MEMNSITVIWLFTTNSKIERLKSERITPIKMTKHINQLRMQSEATDRSLILPAVLNSH
jgi:hypothetical protein